MDHLDVDDNNEDDVMNDGSEEEEDHTDEDENVDLEGPQDEYNRTQESAPEGKTPKKRVRKLTSWVWNHFTMLPHGPDEPEQSKCKKCGHVMNTSSTLGTGNMKKHIEKCGKRTGRDVGQMFLSYSSSSMALEKPKFDPNVFRELIGKAIVRHDLPYQFVEYEGVREAFRYVNKEATLNCRNTVKADIRKLYNREKGKMKKLLHSIPRRICVTSDLWTSVANDGYITLTAHFVDKEWKLRKEILSFSFMPSPHTGIALCDKLYSLLCHWGIEKKLFSISLDNASSNDRLVSLLKLKLNLRQSLLCDGEFFHIRCCCHIINLIVHEGLRELDASVVRVRESVKYCRGSQWRKKEFYESVKQVGLPSNKGLTQDVNTRWDSTFYMLQSAVFYRLAFEHLAMVDTNYTECPSREEWDKVEKLCEFLGLFAKVTTLFSGTLYPTSNLFFHEVFLLHHKIHTTINDSDSFMSGMALRMKEKFNKYWVDHNLILAIAVILDPRYKIQFVEFCYVKLHGVEDSQEMNKVRDTLFGLFDEYVKTYGELTTSSSTQAQGSGQTSDHSIPDSGVFEDFDTFESRQFETASQKSQLELYLMEQKMKRTDSLDVLEFWKSNQFRYPELSRMARDVLSIPVSTVASEAAFSVGGRVIDKFRSALLPENVEALVCTNDWLFKGKDNLEPTLNELLEDVFKDVNHVMDGSKPSENSNVEQ